MTSQAEQLKTTKHRLEMIRCKGLRVVLIDPVDTQLTVGGVSHPVVTGKQFDRQCNLHVISAELIIDRYPVRENLKYGGYERIK